MADTIICPQCHSEVEVTTALSAQLRDQLRQEFDAEARRQENALAEHLAQETQRLAQEAARKARESVFLELHDLEDQLTEARTKLGQVQQAELQLRKERRQLEEQKQELELAVTRTLDEERAHIRTEAKREADEENRLKEADKDKLVADLRRQIIDLKRKSEQGSEQAQGEVMELVLEDLLRSHFPCDTFEAVPVGVHGGDVLHHVHDSTGAPCGTILWECKRTKAWSDTWLPKLRDDQRTSRSDLAGLMTAEMPKGLSTFGCLDGVWVTNRACLPGLAAALRAGLLEMARVKRALEGRHSKVELVYNYLSGSEFRQRVEGIAEAFLALQNDLEAEKRSMHRLWAKREKQMERAVANTAGLYGDVGGILGSSLPAIDSLDLDASPPEWTLLALEPAQAECDASPF